MLMAIGLVSGEGPRGWSTTYRTTDTTIDSNLALHLTLDLHLDPSLIKSLCCTALPSLTCSETSVA